MSVSLFSLFNFAVFRDSTRRFTFGNRQQPRELALTSLRVSELNSYDVPTDKTAVNVWTYPVSDTRKLRLLAIQAAEGNSTLFARLVFTNSAGANAIQIVLPVPQHVPFILGGEGAFIAPTLASGEATELRTVDLVNNGGTVLGAEVAIAYE